MDQLLLLLQDPVPLFQQRRGLRPLADGLGLPLGLGEDLPGLALPLLPGGLQGGLGLGPGLVQQPLGLLLGGLFNLF